MGTPGRYGRSEKTQGGHQRRRARKPLHHLPLYISSTSVPVLRPPAIPGLTPTEFPIPFRAFAASTRTVVGPGRAAEGGVGCAGQLTPPRTDAPRGGLLVVRGDALPPSPGLHTDGAMSRCDRRRQPAARNNSELFLTGDFNLARAGVIGPRAAALRGLSTLCDATVTSVVTRRNFATGPGRHSRLIVRVTRRGFFRGQE